MVSLASGLLVAFAHAADTAVACESVLSQRGSSVGNGKRKYLSVNMESGV